MRHCSDEMNCNDFLCVCMVLHVCLCVWECGIICCMCARVSAKILYSSKANSRRKQRFHSSIYFKEKNRQTISGRRHRCSTLKTKGIGRNIPLPHGQVSKYLADWYPNTYWWTKSPNRSPEREWDVFSISIGSHWQWLSKCFLISRAERGKTSLPLFCFRSKRRRNFQLLFIP